MEKRPLGKNGPDVSIQGLGCMGMSEFYGSTDEAEAVATIRRALELGIDFLDTADVYGRGANERLVGTVIRERRDEVFLATKFAIVRNDRGEFLGINGRPEYVQTACEASLERLGVETIDLYYQHRIDPKTPIEETVGAMAELVKQGKVRYLGLSEAPAEEIRKAAAVHPIAALQSEYSLWTRDPEGNILDTCRELGIAFVAYSPLGRGFLTGKIKKPDDLEPGDWRLTTGRFQRENFEQNLALARIVEEHARQKGCKPAQLALAWVHAQGKDVYPIPGTKRRTYLEENVAALSVELTQEEIDRLSEAIPPGAAQGARYPG
jgi:aryl-alcohol dehydrogenase-like predicted oxidoreductase